MQRYFQNNLDNGIQPLALSPVVPESRSVKLTDKVPVFFFSSRKPFGRMRLRPMVYIIDMKFDFLRLKRLVEHFRCDLVHAHSIETAYYAYKLGLPVVYDDWEFELFYYDYYYESNVLNESSNSITLPAKKLFSNRKRAVVKDVILEILPEVPVIVTNDEVRRFYERLGAKRIWTVPNVPLRMEREYGFGVDVPKRQKTSTCYIGNMSLDEKAKLRNTLGVRELWQKHDLGTLYVFEGKRFVPHLELFRKVREFHYNLLFWHPLKVHKFYLQNKPFVASVVGVPTIIGRSLKSTVSLLREYAITVDSLEEIPSAIKQSDPLKERPVYPDHFWEYYQDRILEAYRSCLL
jgi:hypothetical protein